MFACGIHFDADGSVRQHLSILDPLLREWIGEDYLRHYLPEIDLFRYCPDEGPHSIAVTRNTRYGKTSYDSDRFRFELSYLDAEDRFPREENLDRMTRALELFWSHGIPTCTPGMIDELPNGGGEDGPVPWP